MEQIQSGSDTDNYYRCTMTVKNYSATVICKNKLDGRQKGAQALLKVYIYSNKYYVNVFYWHGVAL